MDFEMIDTPNVNDIYCKWDYPTVQKRPYKY